MIKLDHPRAAAAALVALLTVSGNLLGQTCSGGPDGGTDATGNQCNAVSEPVRAGDGFADAMQAYEHGDYEQAVQLFRVPAGAGNAEAQELLGFLHLYGETLYPGVERDPRAAILWLDRAARQGRPGARFVHCLLERQIMGTVDTKLGCVDRASGTDDVARVPGDLDRRAHASGN